MIMLKYTASDGTLRYIPEIRAGHLIESVGASLTVWWSGDGGLRVEGVVLRECSVLMNHVEELFRSGETKFPSDHFPLPLLVRAALLGVWDRHRSESRPREEFDKFSKQVCRFVRIVVIPPDMVKEMMK